MAKEGFFGSAKKKRQSYEGSPAKSYPPSASESPSTASSRISKTSSVRKTPGKKLLKRLFCGPIAKSKDSFYGETSLEGPLDSNSTSGSASPSGDYPPRSVSTAPPSSFSSNSTRDNHLPPPETASSGYRQQSPARNSMTAIDPTTVPLPESPVQPSRNELKQKISEILSSAALSPDTMDEEVYLPQSSSSYSDENYNMNTTPSRQHFYASTSEDSSSFGDMPMRTPGMGIPTPQPKSSLYDDEENHTTSLVFPHPLRAITESPSPQVTRHVNLSQSVSGSQESQITTSAAARNDHEDEDAAFLPDDFKKVEEVYTWVEVQRYVKEAEDELQYQLEYRHQQELEDALESHLREHGTQWKQDAEAEYSRLNRIIKEEKARTEQKHSEVLDLVSSINDLESQVGAQSMEKRRLQAQVKGLRDQIENDTSANNQAKDLYLNQLHQQIQELQSELQEAKSKQQDPEELQTLKAAKAEADRKVEEMERLVLQTQNQLKNMELDHSYASEEHNLDAVRAANEKELQDLQAANRSAQEQIHSLEAELDAMRKNQQQSSNDEENIVLKSEKAVLERKLRELQAKLSAKIAAADEQSTTQVAQLQDARYQIESLERQVAESRKSSTQAINESFVSAASHEELQAAKAAVETVQSERAGDRHDKSELGNRLTKMKQELMLSPRRRKGRESKVEIGTLTVEVLPSPANSMSQSFSKDDEEALVRLRSDLESLRSERDALQEQLRQLEKDQANSSNETAEQVRQELGREIQVLKDELDQRSKEFEAEKRSLQADLSVQKIEGFTSEIESLKKEHNSSVEEQRQRMKAEHDSKLAVANERLGELRNGFEEEMVHLVEAHAKEKKALQAQIEQLKEQHSEQVEIAKATSKEESDKEILALQKKLDQLKIEFEDEKVEIIRTSSRQADELQTKLSMQQQEHEEELESLQCKIKSLESEIDQLRAEAQAKEALTVTTQYLEEMKAKHERDVGALKSKSQDETEKLEKELESALTDKANLESRVATLEDKLDATIENHKKQVEEATAKAKQDMERELQQLEKTLKNTEAGDNALKNQIAELQSKAKTDQEEFSRRIREVRDEHNKEIDDLLKQLDLVEAEHSEKTTQMQNTVKEKDAVISALGSQLTEAENKLSTVTQEIEAMAKRVEELEEEIREARQEAESKAKEIKGLMAERAKAAREEERLREQLCADAREEMVQQAERQFKDLNNLYKKLKLSYDEATAKIASLEKELAAAKKRADQIKREKEKREQDLEDELAQTKAASATADWNASKKMKQYRTDLEKAKQSEEDLQVKLDEALATSSSVERTLANVVAEKDQLIEENKEMKAVCEELMEIVEQQGNSYDNK